MRFLYVPVALLASIQVAYGMAYPPSQNANTQAGGRQANSIAELLELPKCATHCFYDPKFMALVSAQDYCREHYADTGAWSDNIEGFWSCARKACKGVGEAEGVRDAVREWAYRSCAAVGVGVGEGEGEGEGRDGGVAVGFRA